jgi:hypothetical protein
MKFDLRYTAQCGPLDENRLDGLLKKAMERGNIRKCVCDIKEVVMDLLDATLGNFMVYVRCDCDPNGQM